MYYTIYKTTNKINYKFYIGKHQTKNLDDGYMGSGHLIKRAIRKYGKINFTKEILFIFDTKEEMNLKEKELVILGEQSYNICEGGHGGFGYLNKTGLNKSENQKKSAIITISKNRIKVYGYINSSQGKDQARKNLEKARKMFPCGGFKGKKHKEEALEKMRGHKRQCGELNSQYGTCWITNGIDNKKIKKEEISDWSKVGYYKGHSGYKKL